MPGSPRTTSAALSAGSGGTATRPANASHSVCVRPRRIPADVTVRSPDDRALPALLCQARPSRLGRRNGQRRSALRQRLPELLDARTRDGDQGIRTGARDPGEGEAARAGPDRSQRICPSPREYLPMSSLACARAWPTNQAGRAGTPSSRPARRGFVAPRLTAAATALRRSLLGGWTGVRRVPPLHRTGAGRLRLGLHGSATAGRIHEDLQEPLRPGQRHPPARRHRR